MKASEFCDFFDFTIIKEHGFIDEEVYDEEYNYVGIDNEGVFHDRYAMDITEITDWFDALLPDYIDEWLEDESRFEPVGCLSYYKEALEYIELIGYKDTILYEVVKCLVNPNMIENDL